MRHYCGIDLHSNNHVVVIDENDLNLTLKVLEPYRKSEQGIAIESTC